MSGRLVPLSEIRPEKIGWLWPGRIPLGAVTILEGNPGSNKTLLTEDIAARVTTGRPMYGCCEPSCSGGVVLLQGEDPPSWTRRKLKVAGADLTRVLVLDKQSVGEAKPFVLPDCQQLLEREVAKIHARLVIIDPIASFFTANLNNDQSVRQALGPLIAMAQRHGFSIILIRHWAKSGGSNPLFRGAGSIGLGGIARSVLMLAEDPGNQEQRVLAHVKMNLGPKATSLLLRPAVCDDAVIIEWLGESNRSAEELLEATAPESRSALQEANHVLYSVLADGPLLAKEAQKLCVDAGVSARTLRRAKKALRVRSQRKGFGAKSRFYWVLDPTEEIVQQMKDKEVGQLLDKLIHGSPIDELDEEPPKRPESPSKGSAGWSGDDDDDPADWWKKGGTDNQSDDDSDNDS